MRRRDCLRGTVPLCLGVAGCAELTSDSSMLSLIFFNHSESPYTVEVTLLQRDENLSRNEARVFSEGFDVEPDGQTTRNDVATTQPYIMEYSLYEADSQLTDQDHVHYYPVTVTRMIVRRLISIRQAF